MFVAAAIQMGELLETGRGTYTRFRPGQPLGAAGNEFVQSVVKPAVRGYVSRVEAWLIVLWDYINTIFLITACEFFLWIGLADLLLYYLWPYDYGDEGLEVFDLSNYTDTSLNVTEDGYSEDSGVYAVQMNDVVFIVIGFLFYFISVKFLSMNKNYNEMAADWKDGKLPETFGFRRKTYAFGRTLINFVGYFFIITGFWNILDTSIWESTLDRDIVYAALGLLAGYIFNDLLAPESIYYFAAIRGRAHQQAQYKKDPDGDPFKDHCCCNINPWIPGEELWPVQDEFVRDVIHPQVKEFISPGELYIIESFNYLNAIVLLPFIDTFQWIGDDVPFVPLWSAAVNPIVYRAQAPVATQYIQPSPLSWLGNFFYAWRGRIIYRIKVVCTVFHKGILVIMWDPDICQFTLINSSIVTSKQSMIYMDIQECNDLTFCVEWGHPRMWALTNDASIAMTSLGTVGTPLDHKDRANGFITIFPLNPFQAPDKLAVDVHVFMSSDDMHFNFLTQEGVPTSRVFPESGVVSQESVPCITINPTCSGTRGLTSDFFGEEPRSLRALMRRYVTSVTGAVTLPTGPSMVRITQDTFDQPLPAFNGADGVTDKATIWNELRYAFVAFRGSWCYRIGFAAGGPTETMQRLRVRLLYLSTTTLPNSMDVLPNVHAGSYLIGTADEVPFTNGSAQFRVPFYSINKFLTPGNLNPHDTGDSMQEAYAVRNFQIEVETRQAVGVNMNICIDKCLGEDGTFAGWIAPPPYSRTP